MCFIHGLFVVFVMYLHKDNQFVRYLQRGLGVVYGVGCGNGYMAWAGWVNMV